jgi:putative redox protein
VYVAEQTTTALTWKGGTRFVARAESGHEVVTESVALPDHLGPSPIELFLIGIAGCTAIDVAAILERMREPVTGIEVAAAAARAETHPKYFTAIELVYTVRGTGVSREKVERAVSLSHSTYCSAAATLRPDCTVTSRIVLDDE